MRIAAYNVENLFDRARVFNEDADHGDILDAHAEINTLFEKPVYAAADKARMLELLDVLGLLRASESRYVYLRRIRGQLIRRPRGGAPEIVAEGRDGWIGWVELKTEAVDETAILLTARAMVDIAADVLAIVEAESRPVLLTFQDVMAARLGLTEIYRHLMVIDGNDTRGIDVGLATRASYPIGRMRSHVDDMRDGQRVFSRDCPEYEITTPSGLRIVVLPNHFKSKFGGNDRRSREKRRAQAETVAAIYRRLRNDGVGNVVVLGDLNDTPDSAELAPLIEETDLRDISLHPAFTEFQFRADNGLRGIGTFGLGNDEDKIDYLLLSPPLWERVVRGGLFRKGAWPGSRPPRWDVYPELTDPVHAASDHHLIWADLDVD